MGKYSHTKAMAFNERDIANARIEPLIKETVELRAQIGKLTEERDEAQRKLHEAHRLLELAKHELQERNNLIAAAAKGFKTASEVKKVFGDMPSTDSPVGVHDPCADGKITIEITKLPLETDHE